MKPELAKLLNDLLYVDNIASEVSERKEEEFDALKKGYEDKLQMLTDSIIEEKAKEKDHNEKILSEIQKQIGEIEKNKESLLKAFDIKYEEVKEEILRKAMIELFGTELY